MTLRLQRDLVKYRFDLTNTLEYFHRLLATYPLPDSQKKRAS
jgi:hypothetical protein